MTLERFNTLCGDWDFRNNKDMTQWHVGGVDFKNGKAYIVMEKYDTKSDSYKFCFKEVHLDITDILKLEDTDVLDFIDYLEELKDNSLLDTNNIINNICNSLKEKGFTVKQYTTLEMDKAIKIKLGHKTYMITCEEIESEED